MFQHLIVPIDGSDVSWAAVPIAARMAAEADASLEVITVVERHTEIATARDALEAGLGELGDLAVTPSATAVSGEIIAVAVTEHLASRPDATLAMSSHGHGRLSPIFGSIADDLLRRISGPIIVFGPEIAADAGRLDGRYVIPIDGSAFADRMAPIAVEWAVQFGAIPWLIEVLDPDTPTADVSESALLVRKARELRVAAGHGVEFETLRGDKPARAILDYVKADGASLVFMCTHGRSGLTRLRAGSVAADIVRHAPVPVVLYRPTDLLT